MDTKSQILNIPVYKTGHWTDEVAYLICSTKIIVVSIPETATIGFDSPEVIEDYFLVNLN